MQVHRVRYADDRISWTVVGDDYLPVEPIQRYLRYCESLEWSPNTIQAYASHLKLYWEFLGDKQFDWKEIKDDKIAEFIPWLRQPTPKVVSLQPYESRRSESTINAILSAVYSFYRFYIRIGEVKDLQLYGTSSYGRKNYKPFLHHIKQGKAVQTRLIKLKEPKKAV